MSMLTWLACGSHVPACGGSFMFKVVHVAFSGCQTQPSIVAFETVHQVLSDRMVCVGWEMMIGCQWNFSLPHTFLSLLSSSLVLVQTELKKHHVILFLCQIWSSFFLLLFFAQDTFLNLIFFFNFILQH
jgi:hypothetical protein